MSPELFAALGGIVALIWFAQNQAGKANEGWRRVEELEREIRELKEAQLVELTEEELAGLKG
jgi:hypothetical protein